MYPSAEPASAGPLTAERPSAAILGVAVSVPVAFCLAIGLVLSRPIEPGQVPTRATTALSDRLLAAESATVVVLGNSTAYQAVSVGVLGQLLGAPGQTVKATLQSSTPLTWYATLAHWVYARGGRPSVVVVAAPADAFWIPRPEEDLDTRGLLEIAGTTDPVVEAHLRDHWIRWDAARRIVLRREVWRLWVRTAARAALGGASVAELDQALDVFVVGVEQTNPMVGNPPGPPTPELANRIEHTILPELVGLVQARGGSVVIAVIPERDPGDDATGAGAARARESLLRDWATERGVGFFGMTSVPLTPDDYDDRHHLNTKGSIRYTRALGRAIRRRLDAGRR